MASLPAHAGSSSSAAASSAAASPITWPSSAAATSCCSSAAAHLRHDLARGRSRRASCARPQNLTRLAQYTTGLYAGLERETGQATGFRQGGSHFGGRERGAARGAEARRLDGQALRARGAGVSRRRRLRSAGRCSRPTMWSARSICRTTARPIRSTPRRRSPRARASAACACSRTCGDDDTDRRAGASSGVATEEGEMRADVVVNCAGMWTREVGGWARRQRAAAGLRAFLHRYASRSPASPRAAGAARSRCLRLFQGGRRQAAGRRVRAARQALGASTAFRRISNSASCPRIWTHFEPMLAAAMRRVPALEKAGVQKFFNGPESFTPDVRYLLGEAPELERLYVAAGFNSIGIQSAGGAGKVLAEWIVDGHPPMDLWDVDIRRCKPFQRNRRYLRDARRRVARPALRHALAVSASTRPRAACAVRAARPPRRRRRLFRRGRRLGARQLVRARGASAALRVQLRPPELVRAFRRGASRGARGGRDCSTSPRSPSSCCKGAMRSACSADVRQRRRRRRRAASSTRSG